MKNYTEYLYDSPAKRPTNNKALLLLFLYIYSFVLTTEFFENMGLNLSMILSLAINIAIVVYYKITPRIIFLMLLSIIIISLPSSFINGNFESYYSCGAMILLPVALSIVKIDDKNIVAGMVLVALFGTFMVILRTQFGLMGNWGRNIISFRLFFGVTPWLFCIIKYPRNILFYGLYLMNMILLMELESRNVFVGLCISLLICMFSKLLTKKIVYRLTYITCLLFTFILPMIYINVSNSNLYNIMENISENLFDKEGIWSSRYIFWQKCSEMIQDHFFYFLFGHGVDITSMIHPHNGGYAIIYMYGIVGMIIYYIFLIWLFENLYKLIKSGDKIAFGYFSILCGFLYQLGAESFWVGINPIFPMPFILIGLALGRVHSHRQNLRTVGIGEKDGA